MFSSSLQLMDDAPSPFCLPNQSAGRTCRPRLAPPSDAHRGSIDPHADASCPVPQSIVSVSAQWGISGEGGGSCGDGRRQCQGRGVPSPRDGGYVCSALCTLWEGGLPPSLPGTWSCGVLPPTWAARCTMTWTGQLRTHCRRLGGARHLGRRARITLCGIPMGGKGVSTPEGVELLNKAVAGSIILFEAQRQRQLQADARARECPSDARVSCRPWARHGFFRFSLHTLSRCQRLLYRLLMFACSSLERFCTLASFALSELVLASQSRESTCSSNTRCHSR